METAGCEPTLRGANDMIGRSPALASAMLIFLLSLGGIPFVLGFWGKMYVFLAAADAGLYGLVFLGAVLAVVALFYYLTIARSMFMVKDGGPAIEVAGPVLAAILACAVVAGAGGLAPQWFVKFSVEVAETITIPSSR
jgi:NADH-quinone oxidoreductase subunit N